MPLTTSGDPPQGFSSLRAALDAPVDTHVDLIGVVEHFFPAAPTKGTDWQLTFNLQDESLTHTLGTGDVLKVKMFAKHENLPKVEAVGDVVIVKKAKIRLFYNMKLALSVTYGGTKCIVIPHQSVPDPHFNLAYVDGRQQLPHFSYPPGQVLTPPAQIYSISLHHALCAKADSSLLVAPSAPRAEMPATPSASRSMLETSTQSVSRPKIGASTQPASSSMLVASTQSQKFSLIKDIGPQRFSDLAVEVLRTYYHPGGQCEVYVTDYTENNLLYLYNQPMEGEDFDDGPDGDTMNYLGDRRRKWPGPYGQLTLQVTLWEPHGSFARHHIREGHYVFLRNVHIKYDRSATHIEGALHDDRKYPGRIDINKLRPHDSLARELESRKQAYLTRIETQNAKKGKNEKNEKRRKRKEAKMLKEQKSMENSGATSSKPVGKPSNSHVRCQYGDISVTSIAKILDDDHRKYTHKGTKYVLPFINASYRANLRVVDYYPHNLEDFAHPLFDDTYNNVEPEVTDDSPVEMFSQSPPLWEWAFYLLVEDARQPPGATSPTRMRLLVADKDAEHLLKLDAKDLRQDRDTLSELREKLFIMWGNLEELKSAHEYTLDSTAPAPKPLSNSPFECCVHEYGVEAPDGDDRDPIARWKRVFSMFGTTIM
ncbi:uncharacterized protein K452DRAFT_255690 [Aplosporella prunicola CBS 121167]|uniref:Protection of telomeres protein 1 n=1 Tax=Aplosporella prunicola CBS 121167 TaxID=1176127 RepID=A0A6A6B5V9_9PEZI|nr:uncharacterized protein K452DRAFT_255690 [Aplosporella prunicola CBS 121167]KAF2138803.1 hypothetical protein K452DRAFT_255690 [Aplosporella prunicola CBS 121167]